MARTRALDNIFSERLWRTVKYEDVFLKDYESVAELTEGLGLYFGFYNEQRLHQSLGYQTPKDVYFNNNTITLKQHGDFSLTLNYVDLGP